jgi:hypothetical protein
MKVNVFLTGDSVAAAKKGQVTSEGYYITEKRARGSQERLHNDLG